MTPQNYLAFDFGAQPALIIHSNLDNRRLEISEKYRFLIGEILVLDF